MHQTVTNIFCIEFIPPLKIEIVFAKDKQFWHPEQKNASHVRKVSRHGLVEANEYDILSYDYKIN
jgi:hypothetical protein